MTTRKPASSAAGVNLELEFAEAVALGDLVAHLVNDGHVHEWALAHHPDDPLPHYAGVALIKLAVQLEEARGVVAAMQ